MQQNIWISKALCWVKETRYKSLHDSIHMTFWKTQYYTVSIQLDHWLPGAEWDEGELSTKGYKETFLGWWKYSKSSLWCRNMAICQISLNCIIKNINFIISKWYLSKPDLNNLGEIKDSMEVLDGNILIE